MKKHLFYTLLLFGLSSAPAFPQMLPHYLRLKKAQEKILESKKIDTISGYKIDYNQVVTPKKLFNNFFLQPQEAIQNSTQKRIKTGRLIIKL